MVFVKPPSRPDFGNQLYWKSAIYQPHYSHAISSKLVKRWLDLELQPFHQTHETTYYQQKTWNKPEKNTPESSKKQNAQKVPCLLGSCHATRAAKNAVCERSFTSCQSSWSMRSGRCSLNILPLFSCRWWKGGVGEVSASIFSMTGSSSPLLPSKRLVETNGKTCR